MKKRRLQQIFAFASILCLLLFCCNLVSGDHQSDQIVDEDLTFLSSSKKLGADSSILNCSLAAPFLELNSGVYKLVKGKFGKKALDQKFFICENSASFLNGFSLLNYKAFFRKTQELHLITSILRI
ncbi:MAG: hypothetical protein KA285_06260 [Bacteroidia bacterium]|nr:hypothetical protein [Bacteroidia bacterium]